MRPRTAGGSGRSGRSARGRRRGGGARVAVLLAAAASLSLASLGCKKESKKDPIGVPPPQGAASSDELSTALGPARALSSELAPTSTRWQRTFVLDDKRAILIGEVVNETIALLTDNAGRTWRSLRMERDGWSTWSVGADGASVLALGFRPEKPSNDPRKADAGAEDPLRLSFASFEAPGLSASSPVTMPKRAARARPLVEVLPAVLSPELAALIVEEAPRRSVLVYAGLPGAEPIPPLKLPPVEQVLPTPYGRPPVMLSVRGRDLLTRPVPEPGKPLNALQKVAGVVVTPAVATQLSATPVCELEGWSFQTLTDPKPSVLAISRDKAVRFPLPAKLARKAANGCGAGRIAVEIEDPKPIDPSDPTVDPKARPTTLALCNLEGACTVPDKPPFRPWLEPHEQSMVAIPTSQGVVAVLISRSAARWGLYQTQSVDGGKVYEVSRTIGEGVGERGRIEIGALVSFGERILMILEADVTGTSRRSWYVTASDDGGLTWGVP